MSLRTPVFSPDGVHSWISLDLETYSHEWTFQQWMGKCHAGVDFSELESRTAVWILDQSHHLKESTSMSCTKQAADETIQLHPDAWGNLKAIRTAATEEAGIESGLI